MNILNFKFYTISLCMIVKDEEHILAKCLDSVKGYVDEIIIVDTGSKDNTKSIALSHGAKVYDFRWNDDFSQARNLSISKATCDYILVLDADEYLGKGLDFSYILSEGRDYYFVTIRNYFEDNSSQTNPAIRLFKRDLGLQYERRIHEHLNVEKFPTLDSDKVKLVVHHTGYQEKEISGKLKRRRNLNLLLKEIEDRPDSYSFFNLGNEYLALKDWKRAYKYYIKAYDIGKDKPYFSKIIFNLAYCMKSLGHIKQALTILTDAIKTFPQYTDLFFLKGMIFEDLGYLQDAIIFYQSCTEIGDVTNPNFITTIGVGNYLSRYKLGMIYEGTMEYEKALEEYYVALVANKDYFPALDKLISILTKLSISETEIIEFIGKIYNFNNPKDMLMLLNAFINNRHPLSLKIINDIPGNWNGKDLKLGLAYFLNHEYENAKDLLLKENIELSGYISEAITLCLLSNSDVLKSKIEKSLNKKKRKFFYNLLSYDINMVNNIGMEEKILILSVSEVLLGLKEFEIFEKVYNLICYNDSDLNYESINLVFKWGFRDVAKDMLDIYANPIPSNKSAYRLIGKYYEKLGCEEEALSYYLKYFNLNKNDYMNLVDIINIYESANNLEKVEQILTIMIDKYPNSTWVKYKKGKL